MAYFVKSEADLKTEIRARIGSPDTVRLTADQLDLALDDSLRTINRLNPRVRLSTQTTIKDQQDYSIAGDGTGLDTQNFRGVKEVYYSLDSLGFFADEFINVAVLGPFTPMGGGLSIWDNPSLPEIFFQKVKEFDKRFGSVGQWVEKPDGIYLRLIPAPSSAGLIVPFFWFQNRLLTDLEARFEQALVGYTMGACKIILGEKQENVPESSFGGRRNKSRGSHLIEDGQTLKKEAEASIRKPAFSSR